MIALKELENRIYKDKQCIKFDYIVKDEKGKEMFEARFKRAENDEKEWILNVVLERTRDADSQVYSFKYILPRAGLTLELIAAIGLKYFQLYLKEEIQNKTIYDFAIGEVVKGM